jgi:LAS superfamily LD-carboxypeptidase LdcB
MSQYIQNYDSWKSLNESANGRLPADSLVKIPIPPTEKNQNHKLNAEAAAAYSAMVAAAAKQGVSWGLTDSYRPFEVQDRIFDWDLYRRTGKNRKKGSGGRVAAAVPGTSNHGWGSALDLRVSNKPGKTGYDAWVWFNAKPSPELQAINPKATTNAGVFGFTSLVKIGEPWHWEHKASAEKMKKGLTLSQSFPADIVGLVNQVTQNLQTK